MLYLRSKLRDTRPPLPPLLPLVVPQSTETQNFTISVSSTTPQSSLSPHESEQQDSTSPRNNPKQRPDAPPTVLKDKKPNLPIYSYDNWLRITTRKVFNRKWVKTEEALEIVESPQRCQLAQSLTDSGNYWLKTGKVRKTAVAAGKQIDPCDQTFEVLCYKIPLEHVGIGCCFATNFW